jgi:hypothetical protein
MLGMNVGGAAPEGGEQPDFNDMMGGMGQDDMMAMLQQLMAGGGGFGEGEEGEGENGFDFAAMMQEMMQQFTSKEALYGPCQEIIPKYKEYLASHDELSTEDREKYSAQLAAYEELLNILDTQEDDKAAIMAAVEKINTLGEPPAEIQPEEPEAPAGAEGAGEGCPQQ